jgi:hypothetical protein
VKFDAAILGTDANVLVHHLLTLVRRARIPLARLHKRIDEEIIRFAGNNVQTIFGVLGIVFVDIHRALRHRKKRLRRLKVFRHLRVVEVRRHRLNRIKLLADAPDHEIDIGAQSDRRVTMNQ